MERSYLFVPGNQFERIGKAIQSQADAIIIDLEDAIAINYKEEARKTIAHALKDYDVREKTIYIRINDLTTNAWQEDIKLINQYPNIGIFLPKVESPDEVQMLESNLEDKRKIIPIIETARGIVAAHAIASVSEQVYRLAFGALDYCLDLNITITQEQYELIYPRSVIAVASKAANIERPIDTVYPDFRDDAGLVQEIYLAKQLGFSAKLCIHPRQVGIVNYHFSSTEEERKWAREVVEAFEKAEKKGKAAINFNGSMIDYPVYKRALAILGRKAPIQTD